VQSDNDLASSTATAEEARHVALGRPARRLWSLASGTVPLNHGSFGACPWFVQRAQQQVKESLENNPDRFFDDYIAPLSEETPLRRVIDRLSQFVDAPAENLALVENATTGIDAVLRSMPISNTDRILITNHAYGAVKLAVEDRCQLSGAQLDIAEIPVETSDEEILSEISKGITDETRLVIVDHIASVSSLMFPIKEIVELCKNRGIRVLIDGAHAVGQVPLSLRKLDADWYVTNLHKWLFAPRGCCLLYAGSTVAGITRPSIVSHHIGLGFPRSFDFVGTRDYSPWLATTAASAFHDALGFSRSMAHARDVLDHAADRLRELGASPLGTGSRDGSMRSFKLPQARALDLADMASLRNLLWHQHRIQAFIHALEGNLILRISAPPYVGREDVDSLADILWMEGWPGRGCRI
jgi:isopenicillin-N epimerase